MAAGQQRSRPLQARCFHASGFEPAACRCRGSDPMAAQRSERCRSCVWGGARCDGAAPDASRAACGREDQERSALGPPVPFFSACPTPRHAASSSFHLLCHLAARIACAFFFFSPTPPSRGLSVSPSIFNPASIRSTAYADISCSLARSLSQLPSHVLVYL